MGQKSFTIGILAKRAGVGIETIRFYQRRGLLALPEKPLQGVRRYTEHEVRRLNFIKQSQRFGFSLDEIKELLNLDDLRRCGKVQEMLHRKLTLTRERIKELSMIEKNLAALAKRCRLNHNEAACPALATLLEGVSDTGEGDDSAAY